jgi:heme oxygenase
MTEPGSIMSRLKSATADLHQAAESRPLQKQLAKGVIAREHYTAYLSQLYLVHAALEEQIRRASPRHPAFGAVVRDHHWREGQLLDDLRHHGVDPGAIAPVPATAAFTAMLERAAVETPVSLLGALYVLEGSTNGAKFIAAALRRAWGTQGNAGLAYMDPHGDQQRPRWAAFKESMDAVGFPPADEDLIVRAAEETFRAITRITDEVSDSAAVGA